MKTATIIFSSLAFVLAALVTYVLVRLFQCEMTSLSLVAGAIAGSQVGVILHHRQPGASLTARIKFHLACTTAATGVVLSLLMQLGCHWFQYPEVSIAIGAVGCFVFPFVITDNLWKLLEKGRNKDSG